MVTLVRRLDLSKSGPDIDPIDSDPLSMAADLAACGDIPVSAIDAVAERIAKRQERERSGMEDDG